VAKVKPGHPDTIGPPYMPVDMRWEGAIAGSLPPPIRHAYGSYRTTLCGIEAADVAGAAGCFMGRGSVGYISG